MKPKHSAGHVTERNGNEGLLQRWARRKSQARQAVQSGEESHSDNHVDAPADCLADSSDTTQSVKSDSDMPEIESFTEHSDVIDFFSEGVSEELRKTALRKLFHMPNFNVRDGLDDYDEDYRHFTALGDLITSDMRHEMERIAQLTEETPVAETDTAQDTLSAESETCDESIVTADKATDEANNLPTEDKNRLG